MGYGSNGLSFRTLRGANVARQDSYGAHGIGWSLTDWMCALAGEVGEAANLVKKIRREDFTLEEARDELAKELADVVTYLDLLANAAGIDLGRAVEEKWNEVAERIGYPARINGADDDWHYARATPTESED
jgi:NTP pyrophosphatase (non-canonical NTP hydrolase)